jgi:hypothetical protein
MGKTLTVLTSMKLPDDGQGVERHGLKVVYFEKKYLVVGVVDFEVHLGKDNVFVTNLLDRLNLQIDSDVPRQRMLVLCDQTLKTAKLPDPDYITSVDIFKLITMENMQKCLSKSHSKLI